MIASCCVDEIFDLDLRLLFYFSFVIAGYDIKSEKGYEQMKAEFEEVVGRHYLKAVHLNDSKGELIATISHCIPGLLFVNLIYNLT